MLATVSPPAPPSAATRSGPSLPSRGFSRFLGFESRAVDYSAPPAKLFLETPPSGTATAGNAFTTQPVVYEEDQNGNVEIGDNSTVITVSLASGTGPLEGTLTATVSGDRHLHQSRRQHGRNHHAQVLKRQPRHCDQWQHHRQPGRAQQADCHHAALSDGNRRRAFPTQPVVKEEDQFGNVITTDSSSTVTVARAPSERPLYRAPT